MHRPHFAGATTPRPVSYPHALPPAPLPHFTQYFLSFLRYQQLTGKFVLRRTKDVIRGSLPAALEVVIFCRPSLKQLSLYERCIASSATARALLDDTGLSGVGRSTGGMRIGLQGVLPLISTLRKLCNHPGLVEGCSGSSIINEHAEQGVETQERAFDDEDDDLEFACLDDGETDKPQDPSECSSQEAVTTVRASFDKENSVLAGKIGTAVSGGGSVGSWKVPRSSGAATAVKGASKAGAINGAEGKVLESVGSAAGGAVPKFQTNDSGKVLVLNALLRTIRSASPGDKVRQYSSYHK